MANTIRQVGTHELLAPLVDGIRDALAVREITEWDVTVEVTSDGSSFGAWYILSTSEGVSPSAKVSRLHSHPSTGSAGIHAHQLVGALAEALGDG